MDQPTESPGREVEARLAELAAQIGQLTREHERLRGQAERGAATSAEPGGECSSRVVGQDGDLEMTGPDDRLRVHDRITYVRTMRQAMFRQLYVVDSSLVSGRLDRSMLREARTALVNGIDAADACLLLDGAFDVPLAYDD
jgi:hypothetical protein